MAEILPARAHRVTVLGFTRNIAATSDGVRSCSGWGFSSMGASLGWDPRCGATRGDRSRMRRVAACVPAPAFASGHENSPATLDNFPYRPRIVTSRTHQIQGSEQVLSGDNGQHAQAEIEDV